MTQAGKRAGKGEDEPLPGAQRSEQAELLPPKEGAVPTATPPPRAHHTFCSALLPGALQRTQGAGARPRQSQRCRPRLVSSSPSAEAERGTTSLLLPARAQASNEEPQPHRSSSLCKRVHWGTPGEAGTP